MWFGQPAGTQEPQATSWGFAPVDASVGSLLVVDSSGRLIGIVTDGDFAARPAFIMMMERNIKHVPVVDDGKPLGMIARHDLLKDDARDPARRGC